MADALANLNLPFVIVEANDRRVHQVRDAGQPVIYGDATQPVVLEAAGVSRAKAILVTVRVFADVRNIVAGVRQVRGDLPVIARADGTGAVQALYALGIQEVTSPEFEAAIEMTRQALIYFNVPAHDLLSVASAIRRERYVQPEASGLAMMSQLSEVARHLDVNWVSVPASSPLDGRSLADLRLRATTGVSVVTIVRDGVLTSNPDGAARLERGDLVAVLGTARTDRCVGADALHAGRVEVTTTGG